jgi:hypothetical protein
MIDSRHVNEEAARQRDVAGDARAFFTERFFCNLDYDFLAGLQHFGNELRAAVLFVPWVPVLRRLMRAASGAAASALGAASAAHGALEAGARLLGNARARGRLRLARKRCCRGLVESFVSLGVFLRVLFAVFFSNQFVVCFADSFAMFFPMSFRMPLFVRVLRRSVGRQCFFMHFVRERVGFLCRVFVIVLIGVQGFLQLFEFRGLHKGLGHGFERFGPFTGIGMSFLVLGFG